MPATNAGAEFIAAYITGNGGTAFNNANAVIGVGDDNTVFAKTQAQLQAELNTTSFLKKGMNTNYPMVDPAADGSDELVRFQATFGTAEANFAWEEFSIENGTVMLTRKAVTVGTKTDAAQWVMEVDVTFTAEAAT